LFLLGRGGRLNLLECFAVGFGEGGHGGWVGGFFFLMWKGEGEGEDGGYVWDVGWRWKWVQASSVRGIREDRHFW
jgi:hypothetical protein